VVFFSILSSSPAPDLLAMISFKRAF
jgi:hypothetical protein